MTKKKICSGSADTAADFRKRAEAKVIANAANSSVPADAMSQEDVQRVIFDLDVHQVQLEMQNDELRKIRTELESVSSRYFDLYELAPVGYFTSNYQGFIVESNLRLSELLGIARSSLINMPFVDIVFYHDQDIYYRHWKQLFETDMPQNVEIRLLKNDGAPLWVWLEASTAQGVDGLPVCHAVVSDISDRKAAEEQLHAAMARNQLILETTAEGIIGIDVETRVTFANPAVAVILGLLSPDTMLGVKIDRLLGHEPSSGHLCAEGECPIREALTQQEVKRVSSELITKKDGTVIPIEYVVAPLVTNGATVGAVVAFHDITKRKTYEEKLRRANEELEQFAYIASHDLRQPLRVAISFIKIIDEEIGASLSPDQKKYFGFVIDGAERMDRMIRDLLEYSRTGRKNIAFEMISLGGAINEAQLNLQNMIEESGTEIIVADNHPTVCGVGTEIVRLYQNLISNAIHYRAPDRKPLIEIGFRDDCREWVVWVRDNGVGIAPNNYTRVFAIFQRLVSSESSDGSGIGLAVCKKISEHHGGRIWIESEVGKGSSFFVAFPKQTSMCKEKL